MFTIICNECGGESEIKLVTRETTIYKIVGIEVDGKVDISCDDGYIAIVSCECGKEMRHNESYR